VTNSGQYFPRQRKLGITKAKNQILSLWGSKEFVSRISGKAQAAKGDRSHILPARVDTKIKRRNAGAYRLHYALCIQL
jgi:hypothetical protein